MRKNMKEWWYFQIFLLKTCMFLFCFLLFFAVAAVRFFKKFYSFIHMCIHYLGHFSPLTPDPSLSLASGQNLFWPYL
jgi:hypothetical protein